MSDATTNNSMEDKIVREIQSLWTDPSHDLRDVLLKEMVTSVVKLRDPGTDMLDVKILHRALKELRYAFRMFSQYRDERKVTIFGSARTRPEDPNYQMAHRFGQVLSENGFMVITGGGPGIMLAGNEGAGREHSFGLNILLPFEQAPNALIADDSKLVNLKYFFTRKLLLVKETHAVAIFPGGFGTMDEMFEVLTLIQTGKTDLIPIVCLEMEGGGFWEGMMEFLETQLVPRGLISHSDLSLFSIVHSPEEAVEVIKNFFRNFHSLRLVNDHMVLRLQYRLSDPELDYLNQEFGDLLESGTFTQGEALPEEENEPHLLHLPRLFLHFNWKEMGRLRQCIDWINAQVLIASGREI